MQHNFTDTIETVAETLYSKSKTTSIYGVDISAETLYNKSKTSVYSVDISAETLYNSETLAFLM